MNNKQDYDDGLIALGNAVVELACIDYKRAKRRLKRRYSQEDERVANECERFFKSSHFNNFTTLDGNELLEALNREI